jgi:transcriptional regulator of acetoin/glycerol metabolism
VICAENLDTLPTVLAGLVNTVVEVPPLRHRPDDIMPLAHLFAFQERRRDVEFGADAEAVLRAYDWPGNAAELSTVVRTATARSDRVGVQHLRADLFARGSSHLTRLERLERDEIVRCLTEPGVTMSEAASALGLSRATLYRKLGHYRIALPGRVGDR